jgi:hypothetical protein
MSCSSTDIPSTRIQPLACRTCEEFPDRYCPTCAGRQRRAVRLVWRDGHSPAAAAALMELPLGHVERLLEQATDRRTVESLVRSEIDNAAVRALLDQQRRVEPDLSCSELARRLGTSPIQVERWLGLRPTAAKTDGRGRHYPGRVLKQISVDVAGRLARAIGYAPCDLDGC